MEHLGVSLRGPQREAVQTCEYQQASEEGIEQIEGGGAEEQGEKEQAAFNAADRQRTMKRFVDRAENWMMWHVRLSLTR
jgi:hypothetical protein